MTARIPLIVNPSVEQIQELPSGDSLSIPGALDVTGTVTGSALHAVKLIADGTIAANAAVVLTSAGKIKAISTVAESHGSADTWYTHTDNIQVHAINFAMWDASQNAVLINWTEEDTTGAATYNRNISAGVLSGTSITWNTTPYQVFGSYMTPYVASNGEGGGLGIGKNGSTADMYLRTYTISGSTITWGSSSVVSAQALNSNYPDRAYCEYLTKEGSSHYFVVSYRHGWDTVSGGMVMKMRIVKWDGQDNITLGTEVQVGSIAVSNPDRTAIWPRLIPLEGNRFLIYDSGDYHVCTRQPGTTDLRIGAANANITGAIGEASHHPVYDPRTKYLITTDHTAWSVIYIWSVDGENINYRFKVDLPSGTGSGRVEITDKGQILYSYIDGAFGNGKQIIGSFNDARNDVEWAPATTWSTNADNLQNVPRLVKTTDGKVVQTYYSGSGGNEDGKSVVSQTASTTLTEDTFLGFSATGYSDGDTARIKVLGNVTAQSGLTVGKKYYVQDDGTVGIGKSNLGVVAGKALTTTSLLVTQ